MAICWTFLDFFGNSAIEDFANSRSGKSSDKKIPTNYHYSDKRKFQTVELPISRLHSHTNTKGAY